MSRQQFFYLALALFFAGCAVGLDGNVAMFIWFVAGVNFGRCLKA